ncbi:Mom family adenine methylcarbamoylation protein [Phytohabitans houttuyneae]|uniref:Mom family adenine methylcarbamoylation protein n=1 Tax=Phytohabitans houttuyneae TaxID=1076126 RepID=UPI001564B0CB|nr:hypothetical protein [Phytohabitans houttuyneae]
MTNPLPPLPRGSAPRRQHFPARAGTAAPLPVHATIGEIDPASRIGQRWWHGRHSWTPPSLGGFDRRRYDVEPIDDATAKRYVESMHYSRSYVAASRRYGMFIHTGDGRDLVGVAVFAIPAQSRVLTNVFPGLEPYRQSLELGRFVLEGQPQHGRRPPGQIDRAPGNAESWFLGQCFRYLADDGIAGVVSFADPVPRPVAGRVLFPGHVGIIYQASNAVLTGRSACRYLTVLPDGTGISDRALQKVRSQHVGHEYVERRLIALGARALRAGQNPARWLPDALNDVDAVRLRHRGCLRYAMLTSPSARRRVELRLPHHGMGRTAYAVGTLRQLSDVGVVGMSYPKQVDALP